MRSATRSTHLVSVAIALEGAGETGSVALTEQAENIEAIERYIGEQVPPRTPEAVKVRDEFLRYMAGVSTWERNAEQATYDRVRNFKLRYNQANAVTAAEKQAVMDQALRGLSTEQLQGQPDRRTATGEYIPPPTTAERFGSITGGPLLALLGVGFGLALLLRRR